MDLRPISDADRRLVENLYNMYRNDLSAYCGDFTYLDENGYFDYGIADELLPFGDGVETYIICEDGKNLGLICATDSRYALSGCAWRFQDIYLIRPARGRGLAAEAANRLLKQKGGRWCLSVYKTNLPARRFWDALIRAHGGFVSAAPGEEGMTDIVFDA